MSCLCVHQDHNGRGIEGSWPKAVGMPNCSVVVQSTQNIEQVLGLRHAGIGL